MNSLAAKTRDKLKEALAELAGINGSLRAYRALHGRGNLADVWELEHKRRKLDRTVKRLQSGGNNICPHCGGVKTSKSVTCRKCRVVNFDGASDERAKIAHNSAESQALLSQPVEAKRVDRVVRAFRRWFEWRQRYVTRMCGSTTAAHLNVCACGAYKTMTAKRCDECREAKKVLRRRIHQAGRNLKDEPPIQQERVPRVLRLSSPGVWDTDTNNSWDDMIKRIENG